MTKTELKPGYVVKFRSGERYMLMPRYRGDGFVGVTDEDFWVDLPPDELTDDLRDPDGYDIWDIMEVYGLSKAPNMALSLSTEHRELLWERSEDVKEAPNA